MIFNQRFEPCKPILLARVVGDQRLKFLNVRMNDGDRGSVRFEEAVLSGDDEPALADLGVDGGGGEFGNSRQNIAAVLVGVVGGDKILDAGKRDGADDGKEEESGTESNGDLIIEFAELAAFWGK